MKSSTLFTSWCLEISESWVRPRMCSWMCPECVLVDVWPGVTSSLQYSNYYIANIGRTFMSICKNCFNYFFEVGLESFIAHLLVLLVLHCRLVLNIFYAKVRKEDAHGLTFLSSWKRSWWYRILSFCWRVVWKLWFWIIWIAFIPPFLFLRRERKTLKFSVLGVTIRKDVHGYLSTSVYRNLAFLDIF